MLAGCGRLTAGRSHESAFFAAKFGPGENRSGRILASTMRCPYADLDAFLTEHRLCRPGLDDPAVSPMLVALWCSCGGTNRGQAATAFGPSSGVLNATLEGTIAGDVLRFSGLEFQGEARVDGDKMTGTFSAADQRGKWDGRLFLQRVDRAPSPPVQRP
jgi:hypothetical protein